MRNLLSQGLTIGPSVWKKARRHSRRLPLPVFAGIVLKCSDPCCCTTRPSIPHAENNQNGVACRTRDAANVPYQPAANLPPDAASEEALYRWHRNFATQGELSAAVGCVGPEGTDLKSWTNMKVLGRTSDRVRCMATKNDSSIPSNSFPCIAANEAHKEHRTAGVMLQSAHHPQSTSQMPSRFFPVAPSRMRI